ncbi:nucleoside-diphosphate-sugar epimerase [Desulfocapsa sulfexigens DSM 10523]|uniref:Nucleoside-diphosphate-sugar epimerase n=1 Tax=Desulfocapsa sulfexigens (strain DSM 10523 / SB164P1) TaxID=1167006 RepID=M1NHG8_DESSD|nr:NAD-dependent epimerase [Desulfocapsa sulfexigens]AGF79049.1 nucleoside-diphosphate-sugar epimerase [Desulfocapsa sulfexigens DSM 10523]
MTDGKKEMPMKKILVTGTAGFIGSFLARTLRESGCEVIGIDTITDYYDVGLKKDRLAKIAGGEGFQNLEVDISDRGAMEKLFTDHSFDAVVNLAAQPGVRYSLINPASYIDTNIVGFANLLEGCRHSGVKHFVYASSSSVYGANTHQPYSEHDNVNHPVSLYAASKKSNELMAHSYSHLFGLPCTGLRFFTVYGPWGRPDMAPMLFARAILAGEPINVFNNGNMERDFTFIDDIVEGVARVIQKPAAPDFEWKSEAPDPATSYCPYRVYNIGNNRKERLLYFIQLLEENLGKKADKNFLPMQPGDVQATYANVDDLIRDFDYKPDTPLDVGVKRFVDWYLDYYKQ